MGSLLELLGATLRGQPPNPSLLDPKLRRWALRTGMGPLLCASIDDASSDKRVAESAIEDWPELDAALIEGKLRTELQRSTLSEVLASVTPMLRRPAVLLKGAATCDTLYPQPYLRPMRDLDLLVHAEDLATFEEALRSLGYQQASLNSFDYYLAHHHRMPFFDPIRGVWVEPHTDLFPSSDPLSRSEVFASTTWRKELHSSTALGYPVGRFSPEYQLLHAACHWSQELEPVASLPGLVDMSLILRRHGETLDWDRVFSWLEDPQVRARALPVIGFLGLEGLVDLRSDPVATRLRSEVRKLGRASVSIQHGLIRHFCLDGAPPGRFLSANNRTVMWAALSRPGNWLSRLTTCVWQVVFPPLAPERYSLGFQFSRLRHALSFKRRS